jgi:hypothetical protein
MADLRAATGKLDAEISALERKLAGLPPAPRAETPRPPPPPGRTEHNESKDGCGTTEPERPAPAPAPQPRCSARNIIDDPTLSVEEKVQLILQQISETIDDELLATMEQLEAANLHRAELSSDDKTGLANSDNSIQRITMRLQKLVERQKQMFELMSTMSSKFNEMCNHALNNLGKA